MRNDDWLLISSQPSQQITQKLNVPSFIWPVSPLPREKPVKLISSDRMHHVEVWWYEQIKTGLNSSWGEGEQTRHSSSAVARASSGAVQPDVVQRLVRYTHLIQLTPNCVALNQIRCREGEARHDEGDSCSYQPPRGAECRRAKRWAKETAQHIFNPTGRQHTRVMSNKRARYYLT